ncbi:NADH-quinone oxidoreductase subunit L [Buchnera aphidicola]|uniref:NADH-quinone oxidoreductase subunit L n=1 Tax=Buchnera aphidicola TaxID=9 RepID=UPI0031B6F160
MSISIICSIFLIPLIGFFLLTFFPKKFLDTYSSLIGSGSIGFSFLITIYISCIFFLGKKIEEVKHLWRIISLENFDVSLNLIVDKLSLTMLIMVLGVGFLIHIFSIWYMSFEKNNSRFFSYTNLFIFSMCILVLSGNLIFMYMGWELVGICSYFLIGYYFNDVKNIQSAMKSFITTRFGDIFLLLAIVMVYYQFGTFEFQKINYLLKCNLYSQYSLELIALFFLLGSIGKSAQIPLHTWLPDAMKGPAPVSALIHAATMVTAGVYLILRMHHLFFLTPKISYLSGIIGSITLLLGSVLAIYQTDIKKILAYSTISQLGYMFVAISINAWNAVIIHLITHSIFKALLFLSAGSLTIASKNEQNIFKIPGFRKTLPITYWSFIIGGLSLLSFPIITSGFYSKELIILYLFYNGSYIFFISSIVGVFLTSIYISRLIFILFFNKKNVSMRFSFNFFKIIPLIILAIFSTYIGHVLFIPLSKLFIEINFLGKKKILLELLSSLLIFFGLCTSYYKYYLKKNFFSYLFKNICNCKYYYSIFKFLNFDYIYNFFIISPYLFIVKLISLDPLKKCISLFKVLIVNINKILFLNSDTYLHRYISSIIIGLLMIFLFLII